MEPQKSILMPIVLSVLVSGVVFGGVGYYIATTHKINSPAILYTATPTTQTTPTSAVSPTTSDSKVYSNTKLNFSINYPTGWEVKEYSGEVTFMSPQTKALIADKQKQNDVCEACGPEITIGYLNSVQELGINGGGNTTQKTLLDYLKNEKDTIFSYKPVKIGSYDGYWADQANIGSFEYYYLEDSHGHVYTFTFNGYEDSISQVLASFKLIN